MAIFISVLALFATLYELYQQRILSEKSVRPLAQVDLGDLDKQIYVYVRNNGMGPMIVDKVTFVKNGKQYTNIEDCIDIPASTYMYVLVSETVKKLVLPGSHLMVFEKDFEDKTDISMEQVRKMLTPITLIINYRDVFDKKFSVERDFAWFSRRDLRKDKFVSQGSCEV